MADEVDIASEYEENAMDEALSKFKKNREAEREALINLKERECEECGKIIPMARLYIVPLAKLCVSCQSEVER